MKVVHPTGVRIATLSGAIINLAANEVRELPDFLATLALGHGAQLVHEDREHVVIADAVKVEQLNVEIPHEVVKAVVPTDHEKLTKIMKEMIIRGDTTDFRNDGQPKNAILNRLFGKAVTEEMRTAAWAEATKVL
jgi:uncharacterized protein (DUF849 family)